MTHEEKSFRVNHDKLREMMLGKLSHEPYGMIMSAFAPTLMLVGKDASQSRLAILEAIAVALGVMAYCCAPTGKEGKALDALMEVAKAAHGTAASLNHSFGGANEYEH